MYFYVAYLEYNFFEVTLNFNLKHTSPFTIIIDEPIFLLKLLGEENFLHYVGIRWNLHPSNSN